MCQFFREEWKAPLFCWHSDCICYWFFFIADNTNAPPASSASLFPRDPANHMGDVFQQRLDHLLAHLLSLLASKLFLQFTHSAANMLTSDSQTHCNFSLAPMSQPCKQKAISSPFLFFFHKYDNRILPKCLVFFFFEILLQWPNPTMLTYVKKHYRKRSISFYSDSLKLAFSEHSSNAA